VPFFARGVLLKLKGFERVYWQYQSSEFEGEGQNRKAITVTREHKENREFFRQTIIVYPQSGVVNPGHFSFPFQYQLPASLPGTYFEEGGNHHSGTLYYAKILYKAKATVDVAFRHNLKSTTRLVINEKYDRLVQPSFAENSKSFLTTSGELHVRVWLNKNAYIPGETLLAKMKANNTSLKTTRRIRIKVNHLLELRAHGQHKHVQRCVYEQQYAGFSPCFYGVKWLPFSIPVNLQPSTTQGAHIQSSYNFDIECDIPGAMDLCVVLPVVLLAPQFLWSAIPPQPPNAPIPPDVSIRPPWQPDESASSCVGCRNNFSLFNRRHHCRHCNQVFCGKCCTKNSTIPKLKYNTPVRVCENCFPAAQAGGKKYQSPKAVMASFLQAQQPMLPPQVAPVTPFPSAPF